MLKAKEGPHMALIFLWLFLITKSSHRENQVIGIESGLSCRSISPLHYSKLVVSPQSGVFFHFWKMTGKRSWKFYLSRRHKFPFTAQQIRESKFINLSLRTRVTNRATRGEQKDEGSKADLSYVVWNGFLTPQLVDGKKGRSGENFQGTVI
ncbi:hypothetical protein BDP27DRAFT_1367129 [Rhodocollybia butyracea]|uniref:Uncharacterized protein n=1 Tax=Rhodocollybia butyracea TaxID=206335 RepID=A0A9P5U3I6_9AGAR|nr:hypothetical protein BDP27DRAFT_1367129 [Rhodocollybia butyracea]